MKTTLSLLLVTLLSNLLIAQTTAIPDSVFEQSLINQGYDIGVPDGTVPTANIDTVTSLNEGHPLIRSLVGIEDFAALTSLKCSNIPLKSLDVSQNKALVYLDCNGCQLTALNVSQNTALTNLICYNNQISTLDVSKNKALTEVLCGSNQLTSLNVSQNTALKTLICGGNKLNCLNIKNGNNSILWQFSADGNPDLTCIEIDDTSSISHSWLIDSTSSYSTNCPNKCTVGIDNIEQINKTSIYPNPTKGFIHLEIKEENTTWINTTLRNALGQVISTQKFESSDNIVFEINEPSGIYFLTIETMAGRQKPIKVVKE